MYATVLSATIILKTEVCNRPSILVVMYEKFLFDYGLIKCILNQNLGSYNNQKEFLICYDKIREFTTRTKNIL